MRREHGPANTKTIGKIHSFTVSRCFISHIHSLIIIGKLSAAEQFRKFKFCKKHISCSTTPLLIQGHTEVVFLANIGNFTSRRRIFGLRFLYFVFWHFLYFYNFLFLFLNLGYFFTHIWNFTSQRSIFHLFPRLWTSQAFRAFGKYVQDSDSSFSCYDRFLKPVAIELFL